MADIFRNERVRVTRSIDEYERGNWRIEAGEIGIVQREVRRPTMGRCYVVAFRTASSDGTGYWIWAYVPAGDLESAEVIPVNR